MAAQRRGDSDEALRELLGRGRGRAAIFLGDVERGEIEAGQISGLIDDLPRAGDVVASMMAGYRAARAALP